jgi:signal transduction histidine kinase
MPAKLRKQTVAYVAVVAGCFAIAMLAGWNSQLQRIDRYAYDVMTARFQSAEPWTPQSVVVAIDEATLSARGGMRRDRSILAEALDKLAEAKPKVIALDVILADSQDAAEDARLEASMRATRNLILPCELVNGKWEDPVPRFKQLAAGLGHVDLEQYSLDGVNRQIPLEQTAAGQRRWALSLEAFRLMRGYAIVESPQDVQVGETLIPATREASSANPEAGADTSAGRLMFVSYLQGGIPTVSALEIERYANLIRGKTVFLGVTALTAARDRLVNPYGQNVPGVAVHAHAFETMARGHFLTSASNLNVLLVCALFAAGAGLIFGLLSGWQAYGLGVVLLALAHAAPVEFFRHGVVFPYFAPVAVAWLGTAGAASFQHFFVRRQLRRSESERSRYQQALHWAAHEMRTPLTAIQGSSEIMTRYALPDDKRKQLSEMINSESKRLARMIQTFLDVERLAEGEMEMKREPFAVADVVEACMRRAAPIAERKHISLMLDARAEGTMTGDRELMEYAFYNLLTNAVKYSPSNTEVHVRSDLNQGEFRLAVQDQGIGMDQKELKSIFKKFYRTKRAEASGEVGTGIGLSIVEQIVAHHGGRMEVASEPGRGSCFTMVLRAGQTAASSPNAETVDRRG